MAEVASRAGVPVYAIAGRIAAELPDAVRGPFQGLLSLSELAGSAEAAISDPETWLRQAGRAIAAGL